MRKHLNYPLCGSKVKNSVPPPRRLIFFFFLTGRMHTYTCARTHTACLHYIPKRPRRVGVMSREEIGQSVNVPIHIPATLARRRVTVALAFSRSHGLASLARGVSRPVVWVSPKIAAADCSNIGTDGTRTRINPRASQRGTTSLAITRTAIPFLSAEFAFERKPGIPAGRRTGSPATAAAPGRGRTSRRAMAVAAAVGDGGGI